MNIAARWARLPDGLVLAFVTAVTVCAAFGDYATRTNFDFLIFYLVPLFIVTWRWGGWTSYGYVVIDILLHAEVVRVTNPAATFPAFFYWDLVENMAVLSLFVFGLIRLKLTMLQLQEALRLKTEFLNIAAHDLKNPLTGILGYSDLLTRPGATQQPTDVVEMAQLINQSARRMLYLIRNLLDVSRFESHQFQPELKAVDLTTVTQGLVAQNGKRAAQKNILVRNELEDAVPVWADKMLTEQVLDNLLSNAIKFSPPGKSVFIRSRTEADRVLWEVQDQGPGLSAADKTKLFQKFSRLSARPTAGENSTGLGLSIVKLLVEAMGGQVWCNSEPGHGATFSIALPRPKTAGASPAHGSQL